MAGMTAGYTGHVSFIGWVWMKEKEIENKIQSSLKMLTSLLKAGKLLHKWGGGSTSVK